MIKKVYFLFIFLFFKQVIFAQEILLDSLNDGNTFSTCSGVLSGSEGLFSGGDYLNDQDYTITICADSFGTPVTLDFSVFDLNTIGAIDDYLAIYDGSNIGANLLGTFTNNQLNGTTISATNGNTDGCLTLNFVSNNFGEGSFFAAISCGIPCERPIAIVTHDAPNLGKICIDQTVHFDASTSIQTGGFTIDQYDWDFDDGSVDSTSGDTTSHAYSQPGQYKVSLKLKNNDGCVNSNSIDLILLVSTFPSFNPISADSTICVGEVIDLIAFPNNYEVTYSNIPGLEVGPPNFFGDCGPDDPFETILTFEDFDIGQTLENIADLESICINMEHTYSGDLSIELECPDGNSVTLKEYGGGGGSMLLGEPTDFDIVNDDCYDLVNNFPGVGYDYCWTPTMNNGTWGDNSGIYFYSYVDLQGNSYTDQIYLPAGNYESDYPLEALVGCHLNGEWKLIVTDNLFADNGNLFGWTINFSPEIYPVIEEFTPQIGLDADSSFWSGDNAINSSSSLDTLTIQSFVDGVYPYVYTVINNHGCSFTDTVNITVEFPPTLEIFTDSIKICADSVQLFTTINGSSFPPNDNQNYVFQWSPSTGLSDANTHSPMVLIDTTIKYTLVAYKQYHPTCFASDSILVNGIPNAEVTANDTLICGVTMFQLSANNVDSTIYNSYWENDNAALNIANVAESTVEITATASGYYDVVWKVESGWCTKTDTTHISLSLPISIDFVNQTPTCADSCDGSSEALVSGGFQNVSSEGYNFEWNNGTNNYEIDSLCKGNYSLQISDSLGCTQMNQFFLEEISPLVFTVSVANILCAGDCGGTIEINCPNATDFSFDNGNNFTTNGTFVNCAGSYQVVFRNIFGCSIDTTIIITEPLPLLADFTMSPQPTNTNNTRIGFSNETTPNLEGSSYWTFNTPQPLGYSLNENPTFIFPSDSGGIYPVQLIFINKNQCVDTAIKSVVIYDEVIVFIPNSFTPNNSGLNDLFYVQLLSEDISNFDFAIYSRRGELVFQTRDPNIGWNGNMLNKNDPSPEGMYVYELKIKSLVTKENRVFNGSITLIR